ncbi:class I SAM-dependent methyltransferase [Altericroceibacterium endophyticum]|uniref:Methyltransferase n=1 Tax=Altericroceibacterium endophyticum TaxID=1808508 RepID=A0A6I4T923_9SPHN|nr:methyltransferase [Altericroceibacterium endophyticum]MXO66631.1 methyltransferase [Altericroceibacterium endophyticum]
MDGSELTEERKVTKLKRKFRQMTGPLGVFFEGFVKNPVMVGSIIPSSRYTIRRMLEPVDWANCKLFVEYGPGVGTFCQTVLDHLPRDGEYIVIDTNPLFIDYLNRTIHDSRFHAVLGSAEHVEQIVRRHGHEKADYVLSGLPFSTLPEGVAPAIAAATYRVVRKGGAFLTYQFSTVARDFTALHFSRVDTGFEWINIPPCVLAWGWKDTD